MGICWFYRWNGWNPLRMWFFGFLDPENERHESAGWALGNGIWHWVHLGTPPIFEGFLRFKVWDTRWYSFILSVCWRLSSCARLAAEALSLSKMRRLGKLIKRRLGWTEQMVGETFFLERVCHLNNMSLSLSTVYTYTIYRIAHMYV